MLKQVGIVAIVFCAVQTSQAQLHVEPKSWPKDVSRQQLQQEIRDNLRAHLITLEHMRRDFLHIYSPNSSQVHEIERQIRETRADLMRASSSQPFDREKERRQAFEAAIARLVHERSLLLHTLKLHSPTIVALNVQISSLRKEDFSDPYTRARAELLSPRP